MRKMDFLWNGKDKLPKNSIRLSRLSWKSSKNKQNIKFSSCFRPLSMENSKIPLISASIPTRIPLKRKRKNREFLAVYERNYWPHHSRRKSKVFQKHLKPLGSQIGSLRPIKRPQSTIKPDFPLLRRSPKPKYPHFPQFPQLKSPPLNEPENRFSLQL